MRVMDERDVCARAPWENAAQFTRRKTNRTLREFPLFFRNVFWAVPDFILEAPSFRGPYARIVPTFLFCLHFLSVLKRVRLNAAFLIWRTIKIELQYRSEHVVERENELGTRVRGRVRVSFSIPSGSVLMKNILAAIKYKVALWFCMSTEFLYLTVAEIS